MSIFQRKRVAVSTIPKKKFRFYYGWVIVSLAFLNIVFAFGIWYASAVFIIAVNNDLGGSRAASTAIFSIFMIVHALAAWPIGFAIDRFGGRRIISFSTLLVASGLWAASYATHIGQLYLYYGVVTAIGICGTGHFAQSVVIPNWFKRRRGLAIGIALAGSGFGMQVIVPLVQYIISHNGWRSGYQVLAMLVLFVAFPVNAILQRNPSKNEFENTSESPPPIIVDSTDSKALTPMESNNSQAASLDTAIYKRHHFWYMFIVRFSTVFATQGVLIHMVAHMVDRGFTAVLGAFVLGITGMVGSGSKILFGYLSDRMGRDFTYTIGLVAAMVGVLNLIMIQPDLIIFVILFTAFFGIGLGAIVPIYPARAADLFQGPHYGRIYGFLSIAGGSGAAFGSWISGHIFDITNAYEIFFVLSLVLIAFSAFLFRLTNPNKT